MYTYNYEADVERIPCILLGDTHHRARKSHVCSDCRGTIASGDGYRRVRAIVDGEPWTQKQCLDCEAKEHGE